MTSRRSKKYKTTEIVLSRLAEKNISLGTDNVEKLISILWMTGRQDRGMRLTEKGMDAFTKAEIQHYDYPIGKIKDYPLGKFRIDVSKYIDCPYYLWLKQGDKGIAAYIRVYDHKIAMILSLYGDLDQFLRAKENRQ